MKEKLLLDKGKVLATLAMISFWAISFGQQQPMQITNNTPCYYKVWLEFHGSELRKSLFTRIGMYTSEQHSNHKSVYTT